MNNEETIDLSSSKPYLAEPIKTTEPKINEISESVPDLRDNNIASDIDLLQKILSTPNDQLLKWEECTLPSLGFYYDGWADGVVKVKPMNQTAEKILATQRLAQSGQSVDYLFRECCQFPDGFDAADLLLGDRNFLLFYLRGISYGHEYEFALTCPSQDCGASGTYYYDLNELASTIVWADQSLGSEPFKLILPYLSEVYGREVYVGIRFLRGFDANEMLAKRKLKGKINSNVASSKRIQQMNKPITLDDTIDQNLEKIIVSVLGDNNQSSIRGIINKLHARDSSTIREWLKNHTPGIDVAINVTCTECGESFSAGLPLSEAFFRETKRKRPSS